MAKPSDLPTWATDGGNDGVSGQLNVLEPPTSKKQAGWHYLEKLPRNWLNWWMNKVYSWCSYLDGILAENKAAKDAATAKTNSYSGYIAYFTAFCYTFFLFTYILNEIYHKGAKIDITPIPSQRHFDPSVIALFIEAAKERIDVFFRTKIYNFANADKNYHW